MRFKTLATALATVVLSTVLAPIAVSAPVQAQTQTDWHVNDSPTLFGPNQYWYWGDPGHGYGSNYYRYTYAIGGESTADNWARWNMGSRVGRQEIQVYVPSNHATATVNYNITIGGSTYKRAVAQRNISGWHSLGNWNTNGSEVVIAVYDNDATQHHERDGLAASRIGVDAIRMRCVSNCGSTASPPPPPPPPDREITISLGETRTDCPNTARPCRWLSADLDGFSSGRYWVRCLWSTAASGSQRTFADFNVNFDDSRVPRYDKLCSYNGTPGRYLTVIYDGVRSNTIQFSASSGGDPPPPPPIPPVGGPPDPPRLSVRIDESAGGRTLVASWSPPSDDGGSRITGYTVTISRPGRTFGPYDRPASSRSYRLTNARENTTYTVRVVAENTHGRSRAATASAMSQGEPPGPPRNVRWRETTVDGEPRIVASWSPPSDDGGSRITGYTVTISRSGRTFGSREVSAHTRSRYIRNPLSGTIYTVRVRAENQHGSGPEARRSIKTGDSSPPLSTCPTRAKYERKRDGWLGPHRVFALRSFETIDGERVRSGDKGGEVPGDRGGLAQSGCSWITVDSKVHDRALVSGNALLTGGAKLTDDAQVSGNALVKGDVEIEERAHVRDDARVVGKADVYDNATIGGNARVGSGNRHTTRVYGSAQVYGNARVSGDADVHGQAHVFGDAQVYDEGRVNGSARVYGTARIFGNMEVSSGHFDGIQEYKRAAEAIYREAFKEVKEIFRDCGPLMRGYPLDQRERVSGELARDALKRPFTGTGSWESDIAEALNYGCRRLTIYNEIVQELSSGGPWAFAATFFLKLGAVAKLSGFAGKLMKLADAANDVVEIVESAQMLDQLNDSLEDAYDSMGSYGF